MPPKGVGSGRGRRTDPGAASSDTATPGPAGAPTPTPDPAASSTGNTPNPRGQVPRLQSVRRRAPTGSLVPPNPDGTPRKPTLRFQPKAVQRRTKEEREEKERLEVERQRERIAEATELRRKALRGNDRPRGGARGRGDAGPRGRGRGRGSGRDYGGHSGRSTQGWTGGKVKKEPQRGPKSRISANHERAPDGNLSSDENDSMAQYNIDNINQISDSDDDQDPSSDVVKGKARAKFPRERKNYGLRPVRVERYEHVERAVDINTEASSSKSAELRKKADEQAKEDDGLFVEQDEPQGVGEVAASTVTEAGPQIKSEPSDNDISMVDSIPLATADDGPAPPADEASGGAAKLKDKQVTIDDARSKLQTAEERQEYDRHQQDIEYLRTLLGNVSTAGSDTKTAEGDETKTDDVKDERQGKLFLFQFPPMTPNLTVPEADTQNAEDSVMEVPPPQPSASHHPQPSESQHPITLKTEDGNGTTLASAPPASQEPRLLTSTNSDLPPGRVGKLQVRKSGATTIDWGGISLDLNMGSDVNFLQDAIVLSDDKTDKRIWAMSQVSGKFIVTPNWDELLSG